VAEIELDGRTMSNAMDFYDQFFAATEELLPDYGGRNLDPLNDDLRELSEPLTIHWLSSAEAANRLGDWFDRCYATLIERAAEDQPVTVLLE
jgi:RNAse (barnase) inhibitor barstar